MSHIPLRERLVCSPCCLPRTGKEALYAAYQALGFTKYEAFSTWAACRHDWKGDPGEEKSKAGSYGLRITSYHLPVIEDATDSGLKQALEAVRYAAQLGERVIVLFKAAKKELFAKTVRPFLDAIEDQQLDVVTVLQNHRGTAISSLEDYREVLAGINDPRLKGILEVGHFQRVGVSWDKGWELLGERIGLIHVNDIRGGDSVLFGTGEVDFAGLMKQIKKTDYSGDIVMELELPTRDTAEGATLIGLKEAMAHLESLYQAD